MADYLASFYPLCASKSGLTSSQVNHLAEFVNGSCRLEPDFKHQTPAITGLCRPKFSKRLKCGNRIIYWTNDRGVGGSYLVAILKVIAIKPNHNAAAAWYWDNGHERIPQNLFVAGNTPLSFDHTHRIIRFKRIPTDEATVRKWNGEYKFRVQHFPDVAICEFVFGPNLGWPTDRAPLLVSQEDKFYIFGGIPNTRNAPKLKVNEWDRFIERMDFFVPFRRD